MSDDEDVLDDLNGMLDNEPEVTEEEWSGVYGPNDLPFRITKPLKVLTVAPKNMEELKKVILAAVQLDLQVRVGAALHSWGPLFTDSKKALLILTKDLGRPGGAPDIELIEASDGKGCERLVVMAARVTSEDFLKFQLDNDITVPSNAPIKVLQMGGIVAGGWHGVGWDTKPVSDRMVSLVIMDSEGELRTYSRENDPDLMKALTCHLGLWGVVVEMTFKVDPMVIVNVNQEYIKVKDLFYDQERFCGIVQNNWSVEVLWFPFNSISDWKPFEAFKDNKMDISVWDPKEDEVVVRIINKVEETQQEAAQENNQENQNDTQDETEEKSDKNEKEDQKEEGNKTEQGEKAQDQSKDAEQADDDAKENENASEQVNDAAQEKSNQVDQADDAAQQEGDKSDKKDDPPEKEQNQEDSKQDGNDKDEEGQGGIIEEKQYTDTDFESWVTENGHNAQLDFIKQYPQASPTYLRSQMMSFKDTFSGSYRQKLPHAVQFRGHLDKKKVRAMEWVFNLDSDCSNLCKATQGVVEIVQKEVKEGRYTINLPLDIRFMADSDAYLAPAVCGNPEYGGSGHTCYMEILALADTPKWEDFCCYVGSIWGKLGAARPHWCKEWAFLPGIETFLKKAYAKQLPSFRSALENSGVDPRGIFFNQTLEMIFYPKGHPGRKMTQQKDQKKSDTADVHPNDASCACILL